MSLTNDIPILIKGGVFNDSRGDLYYNNDFDASCIKRFYYIENKNTEIIRAWQGHKFEKRWFTAVKGSFKIEVIKIDNWLSPSKSLVKNIFTINDDNLEIFFLPNGYISSIQSLIKDSKLLVMSDYLLNEVQDEYKFDVNYFKY